VGGDYTGRLCCDDVQLTGEGSDLIATFTVTARQLFDSAISGLLWTDQDMQRGIKPEASPSAKRELSLGDGYPDAQTYIFSRENADEMAEKLLGGQRLFVNPLVWNLRPSSFQAYYNKDARKLYLYEGKVYLPDSHHRHQAILKAVNIYKQAPKDYPKFDLSKQFKVELYFLKREDEGNYFFDKNQRPKPTAKSKAYDLTTLDDLSMLAKKVIERTPSLTGNVNRVNDRLSARNPNVVTLSTFRESLKAAVEVDGLDEAEMEGISQIAADFFQLLTQVRSELGLLPVADRKVIREKSLVDSPIMFQGYGALLGDFRNEIALVGLSKATEIWKVKLDLISPTRTYQEAAWAGDIFAKSNPMWTRLGIVKPGLTGRPTLINNRAAKLQVIRALRGIISAQAGNVNLVTLVP
jgi:hypothetical protein